MKKQEENGLAKVLTENGLSEIMQTKITQQEVVEMMLVEKRKKMDVEIQKLKDNISTLEKKRKKEADIVFKKIKTEFEKEMDKIFTQLQKFYPNISKSMGNIGNSDMVYIIDMKTNAYPVRYNLPKNILDKNMKGSNYEKIDIEIQTLYKQLNDISKQKDNLNYKMPEVKAAITRKLLSSTKEGSDILKNMEEIFKNI